MERCSALYVRGTNFMRAGVLATVSRCACSWHCTMTAIVADDCNCEFKHWDFLGKLQHY